MPLPRQPATPDLRLPVGPVAPVNVLFSAQSFGFGPMAELLAIWKAIRRGGHGAVRPLLEDKPPLRPLSSAIAEGGALFGGPGHDGPLVSRLANGVIAADAVFSSFDTEAVFAGWFCRLPVFFYDGLPWFWGWERYERRAAAELDLLHRFRDAGDPDRLHDAYVRLVSTSYHFTVLLAYRLATHVYAQRAVGVESRMSRYPEFAKTVHVVNGVIASCAGASRREAVRKHVLVSLSGSLAPLLTFDQNMAYARGALAFALEAFACDESRGPWIFCCHPQIVTRLTEEGLVGRCPSGFVVCPSYGYERNMQVIETARALFTSPGFKSVQEAAYFGTPVFFLPEQNGGQPRNFQMLRDSGYEASANLTVTDLVCGGRAEIDEDDVGVLYAGIDVVWGSMMRATRLAMVMQFLRTIDDASARAKLVDRQAAAVRAVFGGGDGAEQVADHFLGSIGGPGTGRQFDSQPDVAAARCAETRDDKPV